MTTVTSAYLFAHAIEIHLAMVLLAVVVSFSTIKLALILEDFAKFLRAMFANSGFSRRFTGRLEVVGNLS
jgi:hypothetical protein